jgi:hypothetical protein
MPFGNIKLDRADQLFSLWIRTRDDWTCQRCGHYYEPPTSALQCSHFQSRGHENTRFDPDNCDALCYGCHHYFTSNPAEHYSWQVERKGQKKIDQIVLSSHLYKRKDRKLEAIYWKQQLAILEKTKTLEN